MKKVILSVVVFIISQTLLGQETTTKSESNFGIKGGLNYSTVTQGDFDEGSDPRTSFTLDFLAKFH